MADELRPSTWEDKTAEYVDAGFSDDEINTEKQRKVEEYGAAGFSNEEIQSHFAMPSAGIVEDDNEFGINPAVASWWAGASADIGSFVSNPEEIGKAVALGVTNAVTESADFIRENVIPGTKIVRQTAKAFGISIPENQITTAAKPLTDLLEPETGTGQVVAGLTQFVTAFAAGGEAGYLEKGLQTALKVGEKAAKGAAMSLKAAAVQAVAFDGHDENIANLVQTYFPDLAPSWAEFLATSPNDSQAVGKLKNVIAGLGLDAAVGALFMVGAKSLQALRAAKTVVPPVTPVAEIRAAVEVGGLRGRILARDNLTRTAIAEGKPLAKIVAEAKANPAVREQLLTENPIFKDTVARNPDGTLRAFYTGYNRGTVSEMTRAQMNPEAHRGPGVYGSVGTELANKHAMMPEAKTAGAKATTNTPYKASVQELQQFYATGAVITNMRGETEKVLGFHATKSGSWFVETQLVNPTSHSPMGQPRTHSITPSLEAFQARGVVQGGEVPGANVGKWYANVGKILKTEENISEAEALAIRDAMPKSARGQFRFKEGETNGDEFYRMLTDAFGGSKARVNKFLEDADYGALTYRTREIDGAGAGEVSINVFNPENVKGAYLEPAYIQAPKVKDAISYLSDGTAGELPNVAGRTKGLLDAFLESESGELKAAEKPSPFDVAGPKKRQLPGKFASKELSSHAEIMFREASVELAREYLPTTRVSNPGGFGEVWLADTVDLAKGQGKNKGVLMAFETKGLKGTRSTSKPLADELYQEGMSEYQATYNRQGDFTKSLVALRVQKGARNTAGQTNKITFNRAIKEMEDAGWTKHEGDGFTEWRKPEPGLISRLLSNESGELLPNLKPGEFTKDIIDDRDPFYRVVKGLVSGNPQKIAQALEVTNMAKMLNAAGGKANHAMKRGINIPGVGRTEALHTISRDTRDADKAVVTQMANGNMANVAPTAQAAYDRLLNYHRGLLEYARANGLLPANANIGILQLPVSDDAFVEASKETLRLFRAVERNKVVGAFSNIDPVAWPATPIARPTGAHSVGALYEILEKKVGPGSLPLLLNGVPHIIKNVGNDVVAALHAMQPAHLKTIEKMMKPGAIIVRANVNYNPAFQLVQLVKDEFRQFVAAPEGRIPFVEPIMGVGKALFSARGRTAWEEYMRDGGANSAMTSITDIHFKNGTLPKHPEDVGWYGTFRNSPANPVRWLEAFSDVAYHAGRVERRSRLLAQGKTELEANVAARDSRLDHARAGAQVRIINTYVAFLAPAINDIDTLGRAFAKNPASFTFKVAASMTLPAIASWWVYKDEDWYKGASEWKKDSAIPLSKDIWIPLPYHLGVLLAGLPRRVMESFFNDNPHAFEGFMDTLFKDLAMPFMPNTVQPFFDMAFNTRSGTGGALVPESVQNRLPAERYTNSTSEASKTLARFTGGAFGTTPINIDHVIESWGAAYGALALKAADALLIGSGVIDDPVKPTGQLADNPFFRGLTIRYPSVSDARINMFYGRMKDHDELMGSIRQLKKEVLGGANIDYYINLMENHQADLIKLDKTRTALERQRKFAEAVYLNRGLSPDDKRQRLDEINMMMAQTAEAGNLMLDILDMVKDGTAK